MYDRIGRPIGRADAEGILAGPVGDAEPVAGAPANGVCTNNVPAVWPERGRSVNVLVVRPVQGAVSLVAVSTGPVYGVVAGVMMRAVGGKLTNKLDPGTPETCWNTPGVTVTVAITESPT